MAVKFSIASLLGLHVDQAQSGSGAHVFSRVAGKAAAQLTEHCQSKSLPPSNRGKEEIKPFSVSSQPLQDEQVISLVLQGKLAMYALEHVLQDNARAIMLRRQIICRSIASDHLQLPCKAFNWDTVVGTCCENVIGYVPIPVGTAGPLMVDGYEYYIPMATTEGALVASTSRGCKATNLAGGVSTCIVGDGITRAPCVSFPNLARACVAKSWLDSEAGWSVVMEAFNSTSRFARLQSIKSVLIGCDMHMRFKCTTGDAMGMNMISKGVENALNVMKKAANFSDMKIVSISGNYCTDKKAAAINWIDGRGKSVVAEALIPSNVVEDVLKCDVRSLVDLHVSKNLVGSAIAGSIGGFNAHAANIVAAIFLATGQDPAQVVEGSNCLTSMKNENGSLRISVAMPSIEVGTVGGGTNLEAQAAMLKILGVQGSNIRSPGDNARRLARIIGAATLAGELSLCSALAAGHLVSAHMTHNRAKSS